MVYEVGSRYPELGDKVRVVQKKDYASGKLTEGIVSDVLTNKKFHPRGHKVRLTNGVIGRVQEFVGDQVSRNDKYEENTYVYEPGEEELA